MSILSERLAAMRKSRGLTQQQVVDRSNGIMGTIQVYSNYEKGNRNPDYETLCQLATIYGVTTDFLLGRTDEELPQAKEFGEATGLSNHAISVFSAIPEASHFINAIFASAELNDISHECYLIQNMIERINNQKNFSLSSLSECYLPDDEYTVRISSEDFFAYHSYKLGSYISTAIEKWSVAEYSNNQKSETPN